MPNIVSVQLKDNIVSVQLRNNGLIKGLGSGDSISKGLAFKPTATNIQIFQVDKRLTPIPPNNFSLGDLIARGLSYTVTNISHKNLVAQGLGYYIPSYVGSNKVTLGLGVHLTNMPSNSILLTIPVQNGGFMSQLDTNITSFDMGSNEVLPISVDVTNYLGSGEVIGPISVMLIDVANNYNYTKGLYSPVTSNGNLITQTIGYLQSKHTYDLLVTFTVNGKTTTLTSRTRIICVV